MNFVRSKKLFRDARRYFPGGVNSPVRAFGAVGGSPLFIKKGRGSTIWDEDGNRFCDYVMSWGALILGHAAPVVVRAVLRAARDGSSFGAPTKAETALANEISRAIPSIKKLRFVSSGTEAAMSAVRLSRGFTQRNLVVKFEGCYHGHADSLLVKAGSGVATLGLPGSAGVTASLSRETIVCPFNDIAYFRRVIARHGRSIACVIIEPVAANMGVVLPREGFLQEVRRLTRRNGIVLVFDEVITGFRLHYGGAQDLYNVEPDLTCLGKVIGGGLPIGAYGGRKDIMSGVAPEGNVYQAGTLSGNPVAVAAGLAALGELKRKDYSAFNRKAEVFAREIGERLKSCGQKVVVNRAGSLFTVFFTDRPVVDFKTARTSDTDLFRRYFWHMLRRGVNLSPSQFEAQFLSFSHSDQDLARTLDALELAAGCLK
jgi:glutamate-1-semialdehyde 2,1-aminomutase